MRRTMTTLVLTLVAGSGIAAGQGPWKDLPASFIGDLPCADCPGTRWQIDLLPEGAFFSRVLYVDRGEGATFDEVGRWSLSPDQRVLSLEGESTEPQLYLVEDPRILHKLDGDGRPIESSLNFRLERIRTVRPIDPRTRLTGMYRYLADAGTFEECLSGLRLSVAQEGENAALEAAYLAARSQPGAEVKVELRGRIVSRPRLEGKGEHWVLLVEAFERIRPGENCGARGSTSSLEGTYWKLTRLGDESVTPDPKAREPHLVLEAKAGRVTGWSGCNRLTGTYTREGAALRFVPLASTRMACPALEMERAFLEALERVATWRLRRHELVLCDALGQPVARFEARELP